MHQKEMTKLQALNGAKFDKMYLSGQAKDHLTMLKLFQTEAKNGHDADLKSFAEATIPTIHAAMPSGAGPKPPRPLPP